MKADIGIIGGSGFYDLAKGLKEIKVETPYGTPSGKIALGKIAGRKVAFLPRHGKDHAIPPHKINYRGNIWALKSLGVSRILSTMAVGSVQKKIKPGDFVILDQFVNRSFRREDTYYNGPIVTHISTAFPFCPQLRRLAVQIGRNLHLPIHGKGTVVVMEGPRFSTAAESSWFTKMGWEVLNMTAYPEITLARELEICYCGVALVTDYDAGLVAKDKLKPVSARQVLAEFRRNIDKTKELILRMIKNWPDEAVCDCQNSLANARF